MGPVYGALFKRTGDRPTDRKLNNYPQLTNNNMAQELVHNDKPYWRDGLLLMPDGTPVVEEYQGRMTAGFSVGNKPLSSYGAKSKSELATGLRKTAGILRNIAGSGMYEQVRYIFVGRDHKHACALAAIAQETGNFHANGDDWYIHNGGIVDQLGIDAETFNQIHRWNDNDGMSYRQIAYQLDRRAERLERELLR